MSFINIDIKLSRINLRQFLFLYNLVADKNKLIKSQHESYYDYLLRQLYKQNVDAMKNGQAPSLILSINSVESSKELRKSDRTIRNYNTRLLEAGLLKAKYFHGHSRNYELQFNEFLCPLMNHNQILKVPLQYANSDFASTYAVSAMRNFLPTFKNLHNTFIKQLNRAECLNNDSELSQNEIAQFEFLKNPKIESLDDYLSMLECFGYKTAKTTNTLHNDTGKEEGAEPVVEVCLQNEGGAPAQNAEILPEISLNAEEKDEILSNLPENLKLSKTILKKLKTQHIRQSLKSKDITELRYVYASILYSFSLESIPGWKKRVFPGISENVIPYIAENYFNECKSVTDLNDYLLLYQYTVKMSALYIRKKIAAGEWQNYYTLPVTYFSLQHNAGFNRFLQHAKYKAQVKHKKYIDTMRKSINNRLNIVLAEYFIDPTRLNYLRCRAKVLNTIPARVKQFDYCVETQITVIADYYQSTKTYTNQIQKVA